MELFVVDILEIFVVCLACANDNRLGQRKTFDSDRCLCFQLDKHEGDGEAQSKKDVDPLPLRHIAAKYLRQISSQATVCLKSVDGKE